MRPIVLFFILLNIITITSSGQIDNFPSNIQPPPGFFKPEPAFLSSIPNIGFEAGVVSLSTSVNETDFIRGGVAGFQSYQGYYEYSPASTILSTTSRVFFGIKAGLPITKNLSFNSGLRFVRMHSSSGREIYNNYNSNYFYWRLQSEGIYTDYLKVEEFIQEVSYLALPVEVKLYLLESRPGFDWYIKAGSELCLLLTKSKEIDFVDDEMIIFETDLINMVSDPRIFNMTLYTSGGVNVTTKRGIAFGLEILLPFAVLFPEEKTLLSPGIGTGAKIDISIPLNFLINE